MAKNVQIVFDCHDPDALATFWAAALGYERPPPPDGYDSWQSWAREHGIPENNASAVEDPVGVGPRLFFQRVPERKVAKNRVHLDINVAAPSAEDRRRLVDEEVDRLVGLGAVEVRPVEEHGEYCVNMLDPEGNEFDVQ
jgi:hypothetical protein